MGPFSTIMTIIETLPIHIPSSLHVFTHVTWFHVDIYLSSVLELVLELGFGVTYTKQVRHAYFRVFCLKIEEI